MLAIVVPFSVCVYVSMLGRPLGRHAMDLASKNFPSSCIILFKALFDGFLHCRNSKIHSIIFCFDQELSEGGSWEPAITSISLGKWVYLQGLKNV